MQTVSDLVELQNTLYTSKNPTRRWLHVSRKDWILEKIKHYSRNQNQECALEAGIGSGIYLPHLSKYFDSATAIDIDESYLDHAASKYSELKNLSFFKDDMTCSKLGDNSFDFILCTEVIEHIADSNAAIKELYRLLKPGGVLILTTPQAYSTLELAQKLAYLPGIIDLVKLIYKEPVLEPGHINLMTDKQVKRQLHQNGFSIQETHKSGVYLPLIAEFSGNLGLRLAKWLEKRIKGGVFEGILWIQYYVAIPDKKS